MRVVSLYNMKGGVGKTATTVNLAHQAAKNGLRVLMWDLDPQGATSFYFRVKPKVKGGSRKLLRGKSDLDDLIKATDFDNLDLLPADFSYRDMDIRLSQHKQSRLKRLIAPVRRDYDLIIIDCPPSISALSEQIFRASDLLLMPLLPTTLSIRTLDQVRDFLKKQGMTKKPRLRIFFSMIDRRKAMHRRIAAEYEQKGKLCLPSAIPYSSIVERMGEHRAPVAEFAPGSAPAKAYETLWTQVTALLESNS